MIYENISEFILDYIENDITGRAIMLSGEWGSGKSYYIKNTLKPFLENNNKGYKCVIVSLNGLSNISEISKAIYMELRTIFKTPTTELGNTIKTIGKVAGKTLLNRLVSYMGFDIANIHDDNNVLIDLYSSIDLSNKLIVLEDIERTKIDIIELLGYVNNMCENDGVKVLLISNERELLPSIEKINEKGEISISYTEQALAYKHAKEKTIGDTILFPSNNCDTIKQIISMFGIDMQKYKNDECASDISEIFLLLKSSNYRALIYGCQKAKSILSFIENKKISVSQDVKKIILFGIIAFTQRLARGDNIKFDKDAYVSARLGLDNRYPLFRFCYDFIVWQELSENEIKKSIEYYSEYRVKGIWNSEKDNDLRVLKAFSTQTEEDVISAILNIPAKIQKGDIPYCDYGIILNYLVAIKYEAEIDINIDSIENEIISRLKKAKGDVAFESLFNSGYALKEDKAIAKFEEIKYRIKTVLNCDDLLDFPYQPAKISEYYHKNIKNLSEVVQTEGFVCNLKIDQFIEVLKNCSSAQLSDIRLMFLDLYRNRSISQLHEDDISALITIHEQIEALIDYDKYDKIQKMQICWFYDNLSSIIDDLEGQ